METHGHRRAELRSLALHAEVARRLREDPSLVQRAIDWLEGADLHPHYRQAWRQLLAGPLDALCAVLEADNERSRDLRQVSPFAFVLDAPTRWAIWRAVSEATR